MFVGWQLVGVGQRVGVRVGKRVRIGFGKCVGVGQRVDGIIECCIKQGFQLGSHADRSRSTADFRGKLVVEGPC